MRENVPVIEDEDGEMSWDVLIPGLTDLEEIPDGHIHVVPHHDNHPHILSRAHCWCKPDYDEEENVVMHNSADGREDYETGKRRMH